ncbi:NAD-dependent epimerase [Desulfoplanes formicivorans]|uniref:Capsular biosynthesis protein CpsI n=1 Tax=Desulfoplanes formicivorans TaxID=1592317 RepID=A0A194AGW8_9BACT|nr:NAD-dependent epimerase [Desulfoplanes formicivorans]GAU08455.1 capsular biosynthesis protein CpsI [Desulfoplanes formicivorans]
MNILVTGAAGFIGFHLCKRFLDMGHTVTGIDNLNDYYSVQLKKDRLALLQGRDGFTFLKLDLADREGMQQLFASNAFTHVVNLAAQAGVRYSIQNPLSYVDSNLLGFANVLEGCRHTRVQHLVFASSSSVYGLNASMPFSVHDNVDHPISLYAASKKSNELMAHSYSYLYNLPCTGLRFFTVYGPWGRPDMALFLFTKAILDQKPMQVFNQGKMKRDFTYIDDIIEGVVRVTERAPKPNPHWDAKAPDPGSAPCPYKIYNIGNNNTVELGRFIQVIEEQLGRKGIKEMLPMQPGDVEATYANVDDLIHDTGFKPQTPIEEGIGQFIAWYKEYYHIS